MIRCKMIREDLEKMNLDLKTTARLIQFYGSYVSCGRESLERHAEHDGLRIDIKAASHEELAWALATNDIFEIDDYAR